MGHEAIKLELIEWLVKLEDEETIDYLKQVKDAHLKQDEWWITFPGELKSEIDKGLNDVEEGRIIPHDIVKRKYGF